MKKTLIIFLDIDGVITNAKTGFFCMDIYAINLLRWVCKITGAKIVISSTWRYNHSKEFFENIFGKGNIHDDWKTPKKLTSDRGDEVFLWLQAHPTTSDYLILDDDEDFHGDQFDHLIKINGTEGISFNNMLEIIKFWDIKSNPWSTENMMDIFIHKDMFGEDYKIIIDKSLQNEKPI